MKVWEQSKSSDGIVYAMNKEGEMVPVDWDPATPRNGIWDLGHDPERKHSDLLDDYLSHKITKEQFLVEYRDEGNYRVEFSDVNRSHRYEKLG